MFSILFAWPLSNSLSIFHRWYSFHLHLFISHLTTFFNIFSPHSSTYLSLDQYWRGLSYFVSLQTHRSTLVLLQTLNAIKRLLPKYLLLDHLESPSSTFHIVTLLVSKKLMLFSDLEYHVIVRTFLWYYDSTCIV